VEKALQTCLSSLVDVSVLGPLEVRVNGAAVALGGPKQRALLALLVLHANEVVSRDRLIEGVWGQRPPATAQRSLDSYVSRLRALLGAGRIERRVPGYALRLQPGELDLERFEALLEQGRAAMAARDAATASDALRGALGLWRGPALADLLYEPFAGSEAERLEERRLLALEERIDADLALGRGPELIPELERLVADHPFRERLLGQLMLCLYRAGRQADALAAYQAGRRRLAQELGLAPGPQLRELERDILAHDPKLLGARTVRLVLPRPRLRRSVVAAALAFGVAGAGVTAGVELGTGGTSASGALSSANRVVELDASSTAVDRGAVLTDGPAAMAASGGSLWLVEPNAGAVVRVDRGSGQVAGRIPVGGSPGALAIGGGAVWVAGVPGGEVTRIDPTTEAVTQNVELGGARAAALAFGSGTVWVADPAGEAVLALDPGTGAVRRTVDLNLHPTAIAVGAGAIWVADQGAGVLAQVDPHSGQSVATIHVGNGPTAIAVGDGAVWAANGLDSTVSKINPLTGAVAATIPVGSYPVAVAVNGDSVFVANEYSATVSRIDSRTNAVVQTTPVGGGPTTLVSATGRIWVGTRAIGTHRGGTLTLLHTRPISIDPALQLDLAPPVSDGLTRDGLVTPNRVGGPQSLQLVPDLAVSVPAPTDGGTTYTFRLRGGIRYSNGQPVRAADFRREIERLFRLGSPGSGYFASIVGAAGCSRAGCDLMRGIATDDAARTVTFHLRAPDPNFLPNLAIGGLATPVPPGTPFHDTGFTPIPGTGPYMIASASSREIRYVRNPRFHEWSHAAQPDGSPDQIVMRFGLSPAQEVRAIERGRADWTADGVPAPLLPEVTTRFPAQTHSFATTETDFLQINTALPPFNDVRVRQALNFAVDRAAIAAIYGGPQAATPTCQVLPPGVLGYQPYCPYTRHPSAGGRWTAPDLPRAERLAAASGTRGERVTVWGPSDDPVLGRAVVPYTVGILRRLGYRAQAHLVPSSYFASAPPSLFRKIQMTPPAWADSSPYNFFATWFACSAAYNHHWFCDPRIDQSVHRAEALEATNARAASPLWANIDRALANRAAWVPLVNPRQIDFVSAHIANYQHDPYQGILADQLWPR
jgi:peptide/nickel transport system substrate-binding protein